MPALDKLAFWSLLILFSTSVAFRCKLGVPNKSDRNYENKSALPLSQNLYSYHAGTYIIAMKIPAESLLAPFFKWSTELKSKKMYRYF